MSSLSPKDRVSLCSFTFSDGRRCRTPRTDKRSHFCFDHAQKEARARARQSLGKDLAHYFSGDYLSACDLSTALGCLIPAVIRGDIKPRAARTVAYLAQTLLQAIRISQHEYINAFGTNGWRQSIRDSVNGNHDYRFPSGPQTEQPQSPQPAQPQTQPPASQSAETPVNCHSDAVARAGIYPDRVGRSEEPASSSNSPLATHHSPLPPPPHTPLPPTSADFVEQVLARLKPASSAPPATSPQPAQTPPSCHSERSEEPAFYSSSAPSPASAQAPQTPASPSSHVCHPGRSEGSHPIPATQPAPSVASTPHPACSEQGRSANPREPDRNAPWLNYSPTSNIPPDSKLL